MAAEGPSKLATAITLGAFVGAVCLTVVNWIQYGKTPLHITVTLLVGVSAVLLVPLAAVAVARAWRWVAQDTAVFYGYASLGIAVLFFVARLALFLVSKEPFQKVLLDSVNNILDNLFAVAIFGGLALIFGRTLYAWYTNDKTIRTKHFSALDECFLHLSQALDAYERPDEVYVVLVSPFIFSETYIRHALHGKDDATVHRALSAFQKFRLVYNRTVQAGGRGAYDKTLLGRTDKPELDRATYQALRDSHGLNPQSMPGTTELGYHQNLNEFMTLILGKCQPNTPRVAREYVLMLQIHFSRDFRIMSGFIYYDQGVIRDTEALLEKKMAEATRRVVNEAAEPREGARDWAELLEGLAKFLDCAP